MQLYRLGIPMKTDDKNESPLSGMQQVLQTSKRHMCPIQILRNTAQPNCLDTYRPVLLIKIKYFMF